MGLDNKKKILELCPYSAGACGVWQRVKQESLEFIKKSYEVKVFSSYFEKGTNRIMPLHETLQGLKIQRFKAKILGGESFMYWCFEKEALKYEPDIIIVHNYRHLHTTKALKLAKKLRKNGKKCRVFLVTHAPFVESNLTRTRFQSIAVNFYDKFIGPLIINEFEKIITITKWEVPFLLKLGCEKERIIYIPNGIPEEFFKQKKIKPIKDVLFLGRIAPVKNLETLLAAAKLLQGINFSIVGPVEKEYFGEINRIITEEKLSNVNIFSPVYELKEKIKLIDKHKIFVLPSSREAMPQSLLEAMARGKIVIASKTAGAKEIIENEKTGFLFDIGDSKELANLIKKNLSGNKKIQKNAEKEAKKYSWKVLIESYRF